MVRCVHALVWTCAKDTAGDEYTTCTHSSRLECIFTNTVLSCIQCSTDNTHTVNNTIIVLCQHKCKHTPPIHLHVLAIEEEYGCWDEADVKVLGVHWDSLYINSVDVCHL